MLKQALHNHRQQHGNLSPLRMRKEVSFSSLSKDRRKCVVMSDVVGNPYPNCNSRHMQNSQMGHSGHNSQVGHSGKENIRPRNSKDEYRLFTKSISKRYKLAQVRSDKNLHIPSVRPHYYQASQYQYQVPERNVFAQPHQSQTSRASGVRQLRPQSKSKLARYFAESAVIRPKSNSSETQDTARNDKDKQQVRKQPGMGVAEEYYPIRAPHGSHKYQLDQSHQVNTSSSSLQFDMSPFLHY